MIPTAKRTSTSGSSKVVYRAAEIFRKALYSAYVHVFELYFNLIWMCLYWMGYGCDMIRLDRT